MDLFEHLYSRTNLRKVKGEEKRLLPLETLGYLRAESKGSFSRQEVTYHSALQSSLGSAVSHVH